MIITVIINIIINNRNEQKSNTTENVYLFTVLVLIYILHDHEFVIKIGHIRKNRFGEF